MTIQKYLQECREIRNFNAEIYIKSKISILSNFFNQNRLDSVVIGVSGGVDSALCVAFMSELLKNGTLNKILPLIIPIYGAGTTNQDQAIEKGKNVCVTFDLEYHICDVSDSFQNIVNQAVNIGNPWAQGQMASVLRTPVLYYHAALLQEKGHTSIVVGTTNRDEGAYIGFFGKASDGMVDLQPIADIHKSEVYACAKLLSIPTEILQAKPSGDVFDGKTDEEMIGTTYDILELFQCWKNNYSDKEITEKISKLEFYEQKIINQAFNSIENLHKKNLHKYQVGSPAHYVDVMERKVRYNHQFNNNLS